LAAVVFLIGLVAGGLGLYLNWIFLLTFGWVFAATGLLIDAMALALLPAASKLLVSGRRALATVTFAVYLGAVAVVVMNALGYAHQYIGDAVSGRGASIDERASLVQEIARLKTERENLAAFTPTTAEAVTAATVARNQECGRVGENCRRRVAELAAAQRDKDLTDRAVELDGKVAASSARLKSMPVVASADPQVDAAMRVIPWLTRGYVTLAAADLEMIRLLGIALPTILGGLMITIAMALAQPARR
jgi:hypothetical protein